MSSALLTRQQLAKELHLSLDGVDRLIKDRDRPIPCFRAGRRFLFRLDEVLTHIRVAAPQEAPSKRRGRGAVR